MYHLSFFFNDNTHRRRLYPHLLNLNKLSKREMNTKLIALSVRGVNSVGYAVTATVIDVKRRIA